MLLVSNSPKASDSSVSAHGSARIVIAITASQERDSQKEIESFYILHGYGFFIRCPRFRKTCAQIKKNN